MNTYSENLYRQYLPRARTLAGKFARMYGKLPSEVQVEAESLLGQICCEDKAREIGGAYVHRRLVWSLHEMLRERRKARTVRLTDETACMDFAAHPEHWLEHFRRVLSDDARDIVRIIVGMPSELTQPILRGNVMEKTRNSFRAEVNWELLKRGWSWERLAPAWQEIEAAL